MAQRQDSARLEFAQVHVILPADSSASNLKNLLHSGKYICNKEVLHGGWFYRGHPVSNVQHTPDMEGL